MAGARRCCRPVASKGELLPFTPFHFGPGLFGKSLVSRYFSLTAFISTQVVIDFETLYYLIQRTYPIHRFFHTFLGGTIAGLLTGIILVAIKRIIHRLSPESINPFDSLRPSLKAELSNIGLMIGAMVGGVSHPFLDGIMHPDVRPFGPWRDANPFLGLIGLEALHLGCLFLGLVGLLFMAKRLCRERLANQSLQPTPPRPRG